MSEPAAWARVQEIFHAALDRPLEDRDRYLAEATAGDPGLERDVRSLLDAHEDDDGLIAPIEPTTGPRLYGLEKDRIGPFRILRPLGQGGMGMVFLASREEHDVTQTVALKLIRLDFVEPKVVERFRAERRILARLEHPGIARLITAGATDAGQPYFAMEFVEGISLLSYCRQKACPLEERLRLFLEVCDAVEYAHQQLVVHRDLKPANILVTEDGRAKLLDFGVAKLLETGDVEEGSTRTGGWFTPEYASPEQLRHQPVNTLSDVYGLGVVLHELLTGVRPFDFRGLSPAAIEHKVSHETPPRPSDRVETPSFQRLMRGDLDTIILKALAAEPGRRYASVRELADDIRRFQGNEPVRARPDRWLYRASKFVRRHRAMVAAVGVVLVSLVGGLAAVAWQATVASRARDRAELALEESQSVSQFMAALFQAADPTRVAGDTAASRAILRQGVAEVERLRDQPVVQARMLDALGTVLANMGEFDRASELLTRSLTLRREHLDPGHVDIAQSLQHLGRVQRAQSRFEPSERSYLEALNLLRHSDQAGGALEASVLRDLGFLMPYMGRDTDAERYYADALVLTKAVYGDRSPQVAELMIQVASIQRRIGNYAVAESLMRDVVVRHRRDIGPRDTRTGTALFHLADLVILNAADTARAEQLYREGIDIYRASGGSAIGASHGLGALADLMSARGRHAEAEALLRESQTLNRRAFGDASLSVAASIDAIAAELARQGRYAEAVRESRRGLAIWMSLVGPEHSAIAGSLQNFARILIDSGAYAEADSIVRDVIALRTRLHGRGSAVVGVSLSLRGEILFRRKRYAEAEAILQEALEILRSQQSDEHVDVREAYGRLASVAEAMGHAEEAARYRAMTRVAGRPAAGPTRDATPPS